MSNKQIPVKISNGTTNDNNDVFTVTKSTNWEKIVSFLNDIKCFTDAPWNDGGPRTWSCIFSAKCIGQEERAVSPHYFHQKSEEKTTYIPQELQIKIFPQPTNWQYCGCKSYTDCPKMIASNKCTCDFVKEFVINRLLRGKYTHR